MEVIRAMHVKVGNVLWVDLSEGRTWVDCVPDDWRQRFVGGRGINARYLWDLVPPGIDPLGPENVIIFGTGLATGTTVPSSGRISVTCMSPATHLYLKTSAGGSLAPELRDGGYDFLLVEGGAQAPRLSGICGGK